MIVIFLVRIPLFGMLIAKMKEHEREEQDKLKLQKQFGKHLVKLRKSKGLTAADLARNCYMESSNIARLEKGRANPSLFLMKKLCQGLGIKLEEILKGIE